MTTISNASRVLSAAGYGIVMGLMFGSVFGLTMMGAFWLLTTLIQYSGVFE